MTEMKTALEMLRNVTKNGFCPPIGAQECRRVQPDMVDCQRCCNDYFRANVEGYAEKYPKVDDND